MEFWPPWLIRSYNLNLKRHGHGFTQKLLFSILMCTMFQLSIFKMKIKIGCHSFSYKRVTILCYLNISVYSLNVKAKIAVVDLKWICYSLGVVYLCLKWIKKIDKSARKRILLVYWTDVNKKLATSLVYMAKNCEPSVILLTLWLTLTFIWSLGMHSENIIKKRKKRKI